MKVMTEDGEILDTACEDCVVFFKTPYNHNRNAESDRTGLECKDKSLTDQSFKDETDINTIIDRLKRGQEVQVPLPEHFGPDQRVTLYEARVRIAENNATFYNLEPAVRAEFGNDPAAWERQVAKDLANGNIEGLQKMGLDPDRILVREPTQPPEAAPGVTPAPGTPATAPEPSKTP